MPRKAKKGSPRYYFHIGTENAIIRHNQETRPVMRERIYNEHIRNYIRISCNHISLDYI